MQICPGSASTSRSLDPRWGGGGVCTTRRLPTLLANTLLLSQGQPCPPNPPSPRPGRKRQREAPCAAVSQQCGGPWPAAHPLFPIKLRKASPRLWFGIAALCLLEGAVEGPWRGPWTLAPGWVATVWGWGHFRESFLGACRGGLTLPLGASLSSECRAVTLF